MVENNDADCQCELLKALYEILSEKTFPGIAAAMADQWGGK